MKCPFCGMDNDRVINTRASQEGHIVRRRRECFNCNRRYNTAERFDEADLKVVKKDGIRQPFDAMKLREGIEKACWKRPISEKAIDEVIARIQSKLFFDFDREIPSGVIGELIMKELRSLDQVAYVRFASVYRQFQDVRDFVDELDIMLAKESGEVEDV